MKHLKTINELYDDYNDKLKKFPKEELKHLLKDFHSIINPNPRAIIRLANNYIMTRYTLIAERKEITADKILSRDSAPLGSVSLLNTPDKCALPK